MGAHGSKQKMPSDDKGGECGPTVDSATADILKSGNIQEIVKQMKSKSDEWKQVPINIGIIGSSGSGKSTLINTLRGLTNDHELAVPVGVEETTTECTAYKHPFNSNCVLWDIPGVGTKNFPKSTYLSKIGFNKYDFFLICSCTRFSEDDIWLAKQIKRMKKNFYMLRTKLDNDIRDAERDNPKAFNETRVLDSIKKKYRDDLDADYKLFLISSIYPAKWDFPDFEETLIEDCPAQKRESLILSLMTHSRKVVEQKRKVLSNRIYLVSLASAAAGAVPILGVSPAVDYVIIQSELEFYKEQLGLTDENVRVVTISAPKKIQQIKSSLNTVSTCTQTAILSIASSWATGKTVEQAAMYACPVVGCVLAATTSYGCTHYILRKSLNNMCEDALTLVDCASCTTTADL